MKEKCDASAGVVEPIAGVQEAAPYQKRLVKGIANGSLADEGLHVDEEGEDLHGAQKAPSPEWQPPTS